MAIVEGLTELELAVVEALADAFIVWRQLDEYHPNDAPDFVSHIHALQHIVMSRAAVRAHPDVFHRTEPGRVRTNWGKNT